MSKCNHTDKDILKTSLFRVNRTRGGVLIKCRFCEYSSEKRDKRKKTLTIADHRPLNKHCEKCEERSYYLYDNYYLSVRMVEIISTATHDMLYLMWFFGTPAHFDKEEEIEQND